MHCVVRGCVVLLIALAGARAARGQERRPITEHDLLRLRWVADPQMAPDGRRVAYVLVSVNEKDDRYEASIWTVGTDGSAPRRLTTGPDDLAPRWSPSGNGLVFLRSSDKKPPQLWQLPLEGGEPRQLTNLAKGASAAVWSPDGRWLAFTSRTLPSDVPDDTTRTNDVRIITRAEFRQDAAGWDDPARAQKIWVVPADAAGDSASPARPVTSGPHDEENLGWSRDGSRIYFTSDRVDEPYYADPDANVYAVTVASGAIDTIADINGPIANPAWSPDERSLAFTGFINPARRQSSTQTELFIWRDGKATSLTGDYDFDVGDVVLGDQRPPRGGAGSTPIVWLGDGTLVTLTTKHGRSNLVRFDPANGRREPITTGNHEIAAYSGTSDGSRIALTASDPTHPQELYLLRVGSDTLARLTHHNDSLLAELALVEPVELWYPSFDGRRIHAWLYKSAAVRSDRSAPFILNIHGGPHLAYGWSFFHEFQLMAARGYVMLAPNPRGSTSYGQEFANIIQYRFPGDDYRDLMVGVDTVVGRGWVNRAKLGVTGGSGGGILTNWTITRTDRFAAAVAQRSIADWAGFWYTADFTLFRPSWFRSTPFQNPEEFLARSPVRYAERIKTPLMLIEGEADLRTPSGQGGEVMFRALKALRKPVVMVTFPGEPHGLSRMGKPSHRIARLQHILNWFDKYLQGKPMTLYDGP